jgi:hypothetical protein
MIKNTQFEYFLSLNGLEKLSIINSVLNITKVLYPICYDDVQLLTQFLQIHIKQDWYNFCVIIFCNFAALETPIQFLGLAR